ncbi:MAG: phage integrase N-terminal SAM-like domain-containing protein [Candidatus Aenigmatarchaeota archaeon]
MQIYEYDKRNNRGLQLFAEKYPNEASMIADFVKYLKARGCSQGRVYKYIYTLKTLRGLLNKPFRDVTKEDLINLFDKLSYSNYKESTIKDFKVVLKMFYRWLYKTDDYPDLVRWFKATVKKSKELPPESILTKEEVMLMANVAANIRDRALILTLKAGAG